MTPTEAQAMIPILQAVADGKEVQVRLTEKGKQLLSRQPLLSADWSTFEVRKQLTYFGRFVSPGDTCDGLFEWRVKPATNLVFFRTYLTIDESGETVRVALTDELTEIKYAPDDFSFQRWLDPEWRSVEVKA